MKIKFNAMRALRHWNPVRNWIKHFWNNAANLREIQSDFLKFDLYLIFQEFFLLWKFKFPYANHFFLYFFFCIPLSFSPYHLPSLFLSIFLFFFPSLPLFLSFFLTGSLARREPISPWLTLNDANVCAHASVPAHLSDAVIETPPLNLDLGIF